MVAAAFATAFLGSPLGERAEVRAERCRPFDSDKLDHQLRAPTWTGAAGSPSPTQSVTVTVTSLNAVDVSADAIGYELGATVSVAGAGGPPRRDERALELRLVPVPGGEWRVDEVR